MYRTNFKDSSTNVFSIVGTSETILPSNVFIFVLLDDQNNAIFIESHSNRNEIDSVLIPQVVTKGLGYFIIKDDEIIDSVTVSPMSYEQMRVAANPSHRESLDMSYGADGVMAKSQLTSISRIATQLNDVLENGDRLPQWVHTKISTSLDRLSTAYNYIQSKMSRMAKQNPNYITNGQEMCVMAWTSALLLSHPMSVEEIYRRASGIWQPELVRFALQGLIESGEVVMLQDGEYFDSEFAKKQKLK